MVLSRSIILLTRRRSFIFCILIICAKHATMKSVQLSLLFKSIVFTLIALVWLTQMNPVYAADPELVGGSSVSGSSGVATPITDLQVSGTGNPTVPVKLRVSSGTLSMSITTGLTFTGGSTGSTLQFSGSKDNVNAALATLTYTRSGAGSDTLEASLVNAGEVFFSDNGHLYEYVSFTATWTNANTNAQGRTKYGATGYLTTITSQAENDFVAARLLNAGWMGASDSSLEGDWKWVTGPESGISFWSGLSGGSAVSGRYANWGTGEPNNAGDEDCAQFLTGGTGKWNDLPCSTTTLPGYVVEYGSSTPLDVSSKNVSITTVVNPTASSFTPADNATNVTANANLVIVFSTSITKGTGSILLKKTSDDSTVETIDVTSSQVTGGGTATITINPNMTFDENTGYYVTIPGTTFRDGSSNYYAGISTKTTWNFTTGDFTSPSLSSVTASSIGDTTTTITWTTNENASTRISYGLTDAYGTTTSETDTSPRVTAHTVVRTGLLACTTYHYSVYSRDASSNTSTSEDKTFTTTGCQSNTPPVNATSSAVTVSSGGTTTLTEGTNQISVETPSNFTNTASTVVIQVKALEDTPILNTLGRPADVPNEVGNIVFDVKAIINGTTVLDNFNAPVTITYQYTDADVAGLDESTFWLYHYHNGAWTPLNSCNITTATNTISCTTQSFSIFGLFGRQKAYASEVKNPSCTITKPDHAPDLFQIDTSKNKATLHFTPLMDNVTNYFVAYGYSAGDERFGVLTQQGPSTGVLSYTINDLSPNTTYYFKVRAQNDCMPGDWGNTMSVKTTNGSTVKNYKNFVARVMSYTPRQTTTVTNAKTTSNKTCEYTVKSGDSLWNISQSKLGSGAKYTEIMKSNNLSSPSLNVGQKLKVGC